jgi:hypothetical protein
MAGELKGAFINAVSDWIKWKVVEEAIKTVLAMFIPGAGIIRAIIGIYDTIVFFIQKAKDIMRMIWNFLGSISDIAAGNIGAAAQALEDGLARGLKLVIDFLARFLRLGGITKKIQQAIQKIRGKVDDVIEKVAKWVVAQAKRAGRFVVQAGVPQDPNERLRLGLQSATAAVNRFAGKRVGATLLRPLLGAIRLRYQLQSLDVAPDGNRWAVEGTANPRGRRRTDAQMEAGGTQTGDARQVAAELLRQRLNDEMDEPAITAVMSRILDELRPQGLTRLEYNFILETGELEFTAAASPLAALFRRFFQQARRRPYAQLAVTMRSRGETD